MRPYANNHLCPPITSLCLTVFLLLFASLNKYYVKRCLFIGNLSIEIVTLLLLDVVCCHCCLNKILATIKLKSFYKNKFYFYWKLCTFTYTYVCNGCVLSVLFILATLTPDFYFFFFFFVDEHLHMSLRLHMVMKPLMGKYDESERMYISTTAHLAGHS